VDVFRYLHRLCLEGCAVTRVWLPGFNLGPVHFNFVVDKVALGQFSLRVHQCRILILILLLLLEGQASEACEPLDKAVFLLISGSTGYKSALTRFSDCMLSKMFLPLEVFKKLNRQENVV
jgi:hypothetical protein